MVTLTYRTACIYIKIFNYFNSLSLESKDKDIIFCSKYMYYYYIAWARRNSIKIKPGEFIEWSCYSRKGRVLKDIKTVHFRPETF